MIDRKKDRAVLMFCGSSSIQQFSLRNAVNSGRFRFAGSSIIGLANANSKINHGAIVKNLARMPVDKTLVLLFGNVDVDFIFYRTCCKRGIFDADTHFTRCISAYNDFLVSLLGEADASGKPIRICILAPQLTPLRDSVFIEVTAKHTNVAEDDLRAMAEKIDVGHGARLARTHAFNRRLEQEILPHEHIRVFRIDGDMMDETGALHERFYPPNVKDHHANEHETFKSWRVALSNDLSIYQRFRPDAPRAPATLIPAGSNEPPQP